MNTITRIIASLAVVSLLATAPASARFDEDEGGRSAYPLLGAGQSVDAADILINRPSR